ncbi:unnamed protein product [Caenorhabditis auriculariae]|uniref:G-protein coupled receptors family 1 profile domain-containing protein n=1 Tax=Caenorhabditis auriculariae TaxID=2777116 RepID=A0A8S1H9Z8_9PELO|nr:unnamed protein product [Caenorhabditis auriculariae]
MFAFSSIENQFWVPQNEKELTFCLRGGYQEQIDEPKGETRWLVGGLLFLVNLIALSLNWTLWRVQHFHHTCLHLHFYRNIVSLFWASKGHCAVCFSVYFPITIFGCKYSDWTNRLLASPITFFNLVILFVMAYIAVDRFFMFVLNDKYDKLCGNWHYVWLAVPWFTAAAFFVSMLIYGCYARVNPYTLRFSYECSNCELHYKLLTLLDFAVPACITVLYLLVYCAVFYKLIEQRRMHISMDHNDPSKNSTWKQIKLTMQFSIILLFQWMASGVNFILPYYFGRLEWVSLLMTAGSIANTMTNPLVMLAFHKATQVNFMRLARQGFIFPYSEEKEKERTLSKAANVSTVMFTQTVSVSATKSLTPT